MAKAKNDVTNFFQTILNPVEENSYDEEKKSEDSFYKEILKDFYDTTNMKLKSDINNKQVLILTKASIFAEIFNNNIMAMVTENLLEYSVSKDRKGRIEFSNIFKYANDMKYAENDTFSRFRNLIGGE